MAMVCKGYTLQHPPDWIQSSQLPSAAKVASSGVGSDGWFNPQGDLDCIPADTGATRDMAELGEICIEKDPPLTLSQAHLVFSRSQGKDTETVSAFPRTRNDPPADSSTGTLLRLLSLLSSKYCTILADTAVAHWSNLQSALRETHHR